MNDTGKMFAVGLGLGLVAIVGIYLLAKKASSAVGDAAAAVGTAVNPVSDQNLAYKGANAVVQAVTGDQSTSLGSKIYDWLHPNEAQDLGLTGGTQPTSN